MTADQIADCQSDLLSFTRTMFRARKGADMKPNWHQTAICDALERVVLGKCPRLIINIPPRSGKCVTMNTSILTSDGYMNAHEIKVGSTILSHIDGQIHEQKVKGVEAYEKETVIIKTVTGRETKVSHDHPVLTQRGWVKAEELSSEHYLIRLCSEIDGKSGMPDAELDFLAMMLFEGGTSNPNGKNIRFTSDDNEALSCFLDACSALGIRVKQYDSTRCDYYIMGGAKGLAAEIIRKHGMMGCLAKDKRLPRAVFSLPLHQKYRFIGLMVATDGYINPNGEIGVTLASEALVDDISLLLDTCGVTAFKYSKDNGHAGAYTLIISTTQAESLSSKINCLHKQDRLISRLAECERRHSPLLGYPHEVSKGLTYKCKIAKPKIDFKNGKGIVSHAKFARMVNEIDPSLADKWVMKDFIYDRVKSVSRSGVETVYHLSVDADLYDHKNYISDGYVVHNTELAVVNFIAWATGIYPDSEWIHASYSKRLATNNAYGVREVMRHEVYQQIFPWVKIRDDSSAKDEFRTEQGGVVYATGSEGSITGRGAGGMSGRFQGAIVIDDPHKPGEANSDVMRQNVIDWFSTTMESRKNRPDTPIIVIKQRLHENDLSGWLLGGGNGEEWEHLNVPAINDEGESFWPEQFPLEMLHRLEKASPYIYAGQYLQRPTPVGGGDFKPSMIQIVSEAPRKLRWVRGWDLAATTKKTSDFTASARMAVDADGVIWIDGIQNERESPDGVERMMIQTAQLDGRETMHSIPQDPGQAGVAQRSNLSRKLAGQDFEFTAETGDKRSRAMPFAAQVNAGNVRIVDGPNVKAYLHQLESFPVGKHDDMIDASSRAYNKLISETTAAGLMIPKRLRR